jgi:three-Cys-motif partner protein
MTDQAATIEPASPGHRYGGPWSDIKVKAVEYYLECFTGALSHPSFDLWYIDAFAGSGDREADEVRGDMFTGEPLRVDTVTRDGSARRALQIKRPFAHYVFIEQKKKHFKKLLSVKQEFVDREIHIVHGDANRIILEFLRQPPWTTKWHKSRGVIFLDPYSTEVEFSTLQSIANTKSFDVWFLFNIGAACRLLAHNVSNAEKNVPTLDRMFGPAWRSLYEVATNDQIDIGRLWPELDVDLAPQPPTRTLDKREIIQWFRRLLEKDFAWVSQPLPLITGKRGNTLCLFLAVSNPGAKAIALAKKFDAHVHDKFAMR